MRTRCRAIRPSRCPAICSAPPGAIELVACLKSIETGWVHPTINLDDPDPECDLDYVPNQKRKHDVKYAVSNSFGFGGHNVSLVVGKLNGTRK